jgi:hypothetical protein
MSSPAGQDLQLNVSKRDDLTDDQLITRLRMLTKQTEPLIGRLIGPDQAEGDETGSKHLIAAGPMLRPASEHEPI